MHCFIAGLKGYRAVRKRMRDAPDDELSAYVMGMLMRCAKLAHKQFRYEDDPQKLEFVKEEILPTLRRMASAWDGEVEVEYRDADGKGGMKAAAITYIGKEMYLMRKHAHLLLSQSGCTTLHMRGDKFALTCVYPLEKATRIEDYSDELERLQFCMRVAEKDIGYEE